MPTMKIFPDAIKLAKATIPTKAEMAKLIRQWNAPSGVYLLFKPKPKQGS
jgi:hypothetical protein